MRSSTAPAAPLDAAASGRFGRQALVILAATAVAYVPAALWSVFAGGTGPLAAWMLPLGPAVICAIAAMLAALVVELLGPGTVGAVLGAMLVRTGIPLAVIVVYSLAGNAGGDLTMVALVVYFYFVTTAVHTILSVRAINARKARPSRSV